MTKFLKEYLLNAENCAQLAQEGCTDARQV
jgi:hypothetical protein